jgi:membrane protease YdiL (CAAX protease family)
MLIGFALTGAPHFSPSRLLLYSVLSPFVEEIAFRGYLFRQLHRRAGWGFWPAALLNAALFGLVHIYQAFTSTGLDLQNLAGIVAITALGGLFFAWLFVRWQDNLWVPFAVHAFMNLWWDLFAIDETALGGWLANGVRFASLGLAVALTIAKDFTIRKQTGRWPSLSK